jgi:hypothetical protein
MSECLSLNGTVWGLVIKANCFENAVCLFTYNPPSSQAFITHLEERFSTRAVYNFQPRSELPALHHGRNTQVPI